MFQVPSANFVVCPTLVRHTIWPWPLTLDFGGHGACRWCGSTFSIRTPTLKFLGLTVRKICSRPVTLTFDLLTLKLVRNIARVMGYPPAHFGDTMTIRFRFMGHWANMAETDHVTLTFDLVTLKLVCESHLRWGTFVSNLVTLGLWVLESLCTRRTDRRMDGQKQPLFPLPYGRGHNNV